MRQSLNKAVVVIMLGLIPVTLALSRDEQKKHESLKWIQTAAYFKISQNNVKTKKIENSVLDILIQETTKDTNKKLEDLMEKDEFYGVLKPKRHIIIPIFFSLQSAVQPYINEKFMPTPIVKTGPAPELWP